jgi:hypothetical protein
MIRVYQGHRPNQYIVQMRLEPVRSWKCGCRLVRFNGALTQICRDYARDPDHPCAPIGYAEDQINAPVCPHGHAQE